MSSLTVEARGAARVVFIDRPAQRNAIDRATLRLFVRVARQIGRDREARGVVITGRGSAFVAGGDLRDLASLRSGASGRALSSLGHDAVDALRSLRLPLVAAVNGDAHGGGCELAAACDYRVVDRAAKFHWVQGRLALTTGWGGTARLVELVGTGTAARWLLTAQSVTADDALAARFADEVVEPGHAVDAACAFVDAAASMTAATTRALLGLIRDARENPDRDAARTRETRAFGPRWASREHHDAIGRFLARPRR